MDELQRQVRRASRRLLVSCLVHNLTWSLFAALLVALVAVTIRKFFPLDVAGRTWLWGWVGGCVAAGLLLAGIWTFVRRQTALDAAIEIDLRYGLKERVSSAIALSPEERSSEVGQALVSDANERVRRIDVRERFRPEFNWHPLLPVAAALVVFLVAFFLQDAATDPAKVAAADAATANEQVRKSMQELKKRLAERKKQEATDVPEADQLLTKFEKSVNDLEKSNVDRKKALVKLNDLSKEISDRRVELQASEKARDQLKQLKDIPNGPADRIASALKNGDTQRAMDELKKLSEKLQSDKLSAAEKEQLVKQLQQLGAELQKTLGARQELRQKQQDLQSRIDALKQEGNLAAAGELQQKLDQLQKQLDNLDKQNPALNRLDALADKLQNCAKAMQQGDGKQAAQQLDELAANMQQLQQEMENLKSLDAMMNEIADAKNAMNCRKCGGEGCEECQGAGNAAGAAGDMFSEKPGRGLGEGHGVGDRPIEETETGGYRTRVGAEARPGEAIRVGDANGPNVAGNSSAEVKKEITSALSEDPDPLSQQNLPRREREQTREYFESLRKGR
jgi:hypothetical protein